ncbi:hypothetical protein CerSpe_272460 [Prunus speciosa]
MVGVDTVIKWLMLFHSFPYQQALIVKNTSLMTLPLLPYPPPPPSSVSIVTNQAMVPVEFELIKPCEGEEKLMDLNTAAEIPEEKDLLQQLQGSAPTPTPINVIAPQPVRPVCTK